MHNKSITSSSTEWKFVEEKDVSEYKPKYEQQTKIQPSGEQGAIIAKFRLSPTASERKNPELVPSAPPVVESPAEKKTGTHVMEQPPRPRKIRTSITIKELLNPMDEQ